MKRTLKIKRMILLAVSIFVVLSSPLSPADDNGPVPRILVTGEGSIDIAPDMAVLTLTVMREAETARAALDANSSAMKNVITAMQEEGIASRDLQTAGFSIQPVYSYPAPDSSGRREAPRIVGYKVTNSLTVRVREIDSVGQVLDRSVTLGVNEGGNIILTNDNPSAVITQARVKAVEDALSRATTLAQAAGVKIGDLLEISEQSFSPRPMPMARAEMSMLRVADAVPVATGENTYRVTVNVSFAIDQ